MKKAGLVILFTIICAITFAQAHTYNACCRYGKGNVMGDCVCPGCKKDKDDEIKASQEETKQLQAKAAAEQAKKVEEDKKAKEEAEQKKIAEQKLKAENTITIGSGSSGEKEKPKIPEKQASPVIAKKGEKSVLKSSFMFGASKYNNDFSRYSIVNHPSTNEGVYFLDKNMDTILQNKEYLMTLGVPDGNSRNFPENTGIIILKAKDQTYSKNYTFDIVDIKGNRLFNDENISVISHIVDNYFLIGYEGDLPYDWFSSFVRPVIYNIKTKETLLIDKYQSRPSYVAVYWYILSSTDFYKSSQSEVSYCFFTGYPLKPVGSYKSLIVVKADPLDKVFDFYYFMQDGTIEKVKVRCNR